MCYGQAARWLQQDTQCTRSRLIACNLALSHVLYRYGSSANLVLSTGSGVNGYTLDAALGEFILTHPDASPKALCLPINFITLMPTDQNPTSRENLLIQRRQLHVLPPPRHQIPAVNQVPCDWQVSLQRTIHRVHGCGCTSDVAVRWDLWISG